MAAAHAVHAATRRASAAARGISTLRAAKELTAEARNAGAVPTATTRPPIVPHTAAADKLSYRLLSLSLERALKGAGVWIHDRRAFSTARASAGNANAAGSTKNAATGTGNTAVGTRGRRAQRNAQTPI